MIAANDSKDTFFISFPTVLPFYSLNSLLRLDWQTDCHD